MLSYSILQWLMFFYFYSFFGWCFESAYVSLRKKRFVNRGFIRGPFLPLYGSGAVVMLIVSMPFSENVALTFFAGIVGATVLEYITGACMEALFKVRYWDYSNQKFNFKGYICLSSSIAWGALTVLMTRFIHQPIEKMILSVDNTLLTIIVIVLTIMIEADFATSFRTALDLRDVLIHMERARDDLVRMQKRLDVMMAVLDNTKTELASGFNNKKEQLFERNEFLKQVNLSRTEDLYRGIEDRLGSLKKALQEKPSEYLESFRDEIAEIRGRFSTHLEKRKQTGIFKDFHKRNLILGNPTMVSKKYNAFLEELKREIEEYKKNK
ncbi:MAG: hypothetical protein PHT89_03950 [Lachnospiraceae bacterium]|nr:hypothetical protein [Lachnospiraceae bacterium]